MSRYFLRVGARGAVLAVCAALAPISVLAQQGGLPGEFLTYGVGARALSMGGAFFPIADDASALYWNPAGLAQLDHQELTAMQATLFVDTQLQFLSYAYPTTTQGTFAVGVTQLLSSNFEKINVLVDPNTQQITTQNLGTFSDTERAFSVAWGRNLAENLSFGAAGKYITRQLDTSADTMESLDLAMMYKPISWDRVAVGVQNIVAHASGDTTDTLPIIVKAGDAVSLFKDRAAIALSLEHPQGGEYTWRFGGEYWLLDWWALRAGVWGSPGLQETDFGFGLKYRFLQLDVSQGIHTLGNTTNISLTTRFGSSTLERQKEEVQKRLDEGLAALESGDFKRALDKLGSAVDAAPGDPDVRKALARVEAALALVPNATGPDEKSAFIRKGISAYARGRDMHAAVVALRQAFNKDSKDDKLLALLNQVEKEAGAAEPTKKPHSPQIFTYLDQKIYDARQAVYEAKYDLALQRATDVLDLEPKNETALMIMGSALYMMDQKDKARQVWQQVLQINPNNKVVGEFLKKVQP